LDHDPTTGLTTEFAAQDDGDTWGFRYRQDATPILDANKEQQAEGFDRRADMWHAAHIPAVTIMEWINKHGVNLYDPNHKEGVRRLLNSSEYAHLRTNQFRL
jgi:hypothetical protein